MTPAKKSKDKAEQTSTSLVRALNASTVKTPAVKTPAMKTPAVKAPAAKTPAANTAAKTPNASAETPGTPVEASLLLTQPAETPDKIPNAANLRTRFVRLPFHLYFVYLTYACRTKLPPQRLQNT